jgi:hypothetical protein
MLKSEASSTSIKAMGVDVRRRTFAVHQLSPLAPVTSILESAVALSSFGFASNFGFRISDF